MADTVTVGVPVELMDISEVPELAHLFNKEEGGGFDLQSAINTGYVDLPAGEIIKVPEPLRINNDVIIHGNGARLYGSFLIEQPGARVQIDNLTLVGQPEGEATNNAIQCTYDNVLKLNNVRAVDWFSNFIQGSRGVSANISDCYIQAWNQGIAGGDGAREYRISNSKFGRVGAGLNTTHQIYVNPDVLLMLDGCEFLNDENETNWAVHYYGSDEVGPYATPVFRDCVFHRKVFTCEKAHTVVDGCTFKDTTLQIHNDATLEGCTFDNATMSSRTGAAKYVRLDNLTAYNSVLGCNVTNESSVLYRFDNPYLVNTTINGRIPQPNKIEVHGGKWESGRLDYTKAHFYIGGRLYLSNDVGKLNLVDGTLEEGEVIYY